VFSHARKSEIRALLFDARGAATRERIIDAAADLIYAHGVDRMSVNEVMAASGVVVISDRPAMLNLEQAVAGRHHALEDLPGIRLGQTALG
jgi:hypothetical protein